MTAELIVPLTADQYDEIAAAEQAKAEIDSRKSTAVRFLLLAHAAKERVDAALQAGSLEIRKLEAGGFALVLPGETEKLDADTAR